eukprot:gnl/MRDRNA2_/MRDRNA2_111242_c0_seq1.p1 gnl/MRDRNA2_/MRDRNA2_111242_c0~~gnl/MRDRNA2_/MRDRNA2_111242_c0_seq1.p1  ORF type:complete len:122 (+),score=26.15 gnl/MRDRNA2_/MRDRNA2_111242_c0_seq1:79-444(+)
MRASNAGTSMPTVYVVLAFVLMCASTALLETHHKNVEVTQGTADAAQALGATFLLTLETTLEPVLPTVLVLGFLGGFGVVALYSDVQEIANEKKEDQHCQSLGSKLSCQLLPPQLAAATRK